MSALVPVQEPVLIQGLPDNGQPQLILFH